MKALTLIQPFASLIISGRKKIENRSWPTAYRGLLAIHAGAKREPMDLAADGQAVAAMLPQSAILGTVEVVDCLPLEALPAALAASPWASGPFCWILSNPRPLAKPIPMPGKLRLWDVPAWAVKLMQFTEK